MGKKKKRHVKKEPIIILVLLIGLIGYFIFNYVVKLINGDPSALKISLNGDEVITLKYKDGEYTDEGAKASYKDEDITNNIKVSGKVDYDKVGTYKIKYTVKYKKIEKEIEREIKIIDEIKPEIELTGGETTFLILGTDYKDKGATAKDNYDGDITDKIVIDTSDLDKNKIGTYKVHYKVKDSSGNETVADKIVEVKKKGAANQKIAVLNYHFFYENKSENCNEDICLNMKNFRQQLKYLKDNGYTTLTIDEFVAWMYGEIDVPEKSVLITIDDGAHGTSKINGNHLIPALEEYKMHATLFLITGWWDIKNYKSPYLDVESHTHNLHLGGNCGHRSKVNCIPHDDLLKDLQKSIKITKSDAAFCFPFYDYTDESIKVVKEAGFKTAFVGLRRKASRNDDKYKIPRYPISDNTSLETFKSYVS
ncbi:MAG: DUF5011 domain-containing protein [Bacilli bacterium]|nr:DUF5011 domain-containing protein [Bacilli bacterium]